MSHIVKLQLKIKDRQAFAEAAQKLGLTVHQNQTAEMYNGSLTGDVVHLPGWTYPVVVDAEGAVNYDSYNGRWGDIEQLNRLTQEYVGTVVEKQARLDGQYAYRQEQEDGSLVIRVGGGW